jgi:hypothetical protein
MSCGDGGQLPLQQQRQCWFVRDEGDMARAGDRLSHALIHRAFVVT